MTLVILLALMTGLCIALPHQDFDAAEVLLDSFSDSELDQLLAEKLEELQVGILDSFKEHLRAHENTLAQLHRRRRSLPARPTIPTDYWHGYVFGTLSTREKTVIDSVAVETVKNMKTIMEIYPINLPSTKAIYKDGLGHGYIYKNGEMKLLLVRNMWTKSMSGCPCANDPTDTKCACCTQGGKLCSPSVGLQGNICVDGDSELVLECTQSGIRPLTLHAAVAFDYHAEGLSHPQSHREVIIVADKKTVTFYKLDEQGLQELHTQKGHSHIHLGEEVTHLGLGELYAEEFGALVKKRFAFFFGEKEEAKVYFQVVVNGTTDTLQTGLLKPWEEYGSEMRVWQNDAQIMMGVLNGTNLHIHELLTDRWGRQRIFFVQDVQFPSDVMYWKMYSSGFEKFLIAVTPSLTRVFSLQQGFYKFLQDLTPGVLGTFKDVVPLQIPSCKNDVVLLTGSGTTLVIFVWNSVDGKYFKANETTISEDITGWELSFGSVGVGSAAIPTVVAQAATSVAAIKLTSSLHDIMDQGVQENKELQKEKLYIENEYTRQTSVMSLMQNRVDNAIDVHTTTKLSGDYIIDSVIVDGTLKTNVFDAVDMTFPNTDFASGVSYSDYKSHTANISDSFTWLNNLDKTLNQYSSRLQDAVKIAGGNQKITGMKTVVDGLTVSNLATTEVSVQEVMDKNDQSFPLTDYLEGLISFSDARKITGKKTYVKGLDVASLNTPSLDDIPVSDIATTTGKYSLVGTTAFPTMNAENVNLPTGGVVGGIDLSNAVLLSGPAKLGYLAFDKNVTVTQDLNIGNNEVDGVVINNLYRNALTKAGGEVKGPLTFTNDVVAKSLSASLLSGVRSTDFLTYTVFKDKDTQLTGRIKMPTLTAQGLQVKGKVNGRVFPTDLPLKTDTTLNLGTKTFNHLTCVDLNVDDLLTVDGVQFNKLVTLHRPQTITGNITLAESVNILGNLDVSSSLVKGIDFDELNSNLTAILNTNNQFDVIFKGSVSLPTTVYDGTLRGLNLVDLAGDVIYTSDASALLTGAKTFNGDLQTSEATLKSTFNGLSFDDFVTVNDAKTIAGVKTFKKPVTFSSTVDVTGLVDGVDLKQLFDSALYLDKAGQVVTGRKTFTGTVSAGELDVQGRVSGVDFNTILAKSGDQVFTVPQKLAAASFGALDANQIDMSDGFTMNDIDISVLDSTRMSRKNPTPHSGVLTVNGMVSVLGSLDAVNIGGHNVAQLKSNIVTDDADSIISSDLSFASLTVKDSVSTANKVGANGQNISRINENAVFLAGNNAMTGSVTWGDLDLQGDVAVGGLVNGKDLQVVHNDAVYKDDGSVRVTGKKVFQNGLSVKGNINTETTNDIDLSKRLFTLHTDQDITAPFTFDTITAEKSMTLDGTFDGVDLVKLDSRALKQSMDTIENLVFNGKVTIGDFQVNGKLGGIDVNARLQDAVRLTGKDITIKGTKNFVKDVAFKNIFTTNLNNVNFNTYLNHAVRKNVPINLNKKLKVNGLVSAPSITVDSLNIQGTVDGIDYKDLMTRAVLLDGTQSSTSNLQFTNDVSVKGNVATIRLNDLDMDTHYLTTNTPQTFITNVDFDNVHASANVAVQGSVNNVNLPAEFANTLKIQGGQTITGMKTINGVTIVSNDVEVTGLTGDDTLVDFSSEVVYLTEAPTISGSLHFSSDLTVKSLTSTSGEIGDIDVVDLANNAWYYNEAAIITASLNFMDPVVMKETLLTNHTVDGMLVSGVYGDAENALNTYSTYNEGIKNLYINKCPLIEEAYKDTQKAIFDADYFHLVNEAQFGGKPKSSASARVDNSSYIVMSWEKSCDVTMDKYGTSFVPTTTLYSNFGSGKDWIHFEHQGDNYFIGAASSADNSCSRTNSVSLKLENDALTVHQELVAGERVEKTFIQETGTVGIAITMGNVRHLYSFSSSTNEFELVKNLPAIDETAVLIDRSGNTIVVEAYENGIVIPWVNNVQLGLMEVHKMDDAVLVQQYGKVFLMCSVTRELVSGVVHNLELYLLDPVSGFSWLDSKPLNEPAKLTSFFAGNAATGATVLVAVQENWCPEVYTLHGMKFKPFVEMNTPLTWWVEYFSVPDATFPEISKHALLIGQGNGVKLLELKMNGLTHEAGYIECNPAAFKYPELMPIVPV